MRFLKPYYLARPAQLVRRIVRSMSGASRDRLVTLPWGGRLRVDPAEAIGRSIWLTGIHELAVCEALWRLAAPGDLAVDCGANIGQMVSLLACRTSGQGRVVGFEPHPRLFEQLRRNTALITSEPGLAPVEIRPLALGTLPGVAMLIEPAAFADNRGVARLGSGEGAGFQVVVTTLALEFPVDQIGVLKIDVEGSELAVLEGSRPVFQERRVRDLVIEVTEATNADVQEELARFGYALFGLANSLLGPRLGPSDRRLAAAHETWNLVATIDPDRARARFSNLGWRCLA